MSLEQEIVQEQARSAAPLLRVLSGAPAGGQDGAAGGAAGAPSAPLKGLLKPSGGEERKKRKAGVSWAPDHRLEQVRMFHKRKVTGSDDVIVSGPTSSTDTTDNDADIPAVAGLQAHLKARTELARGVRCELRTRGAAGETCNG